MATHSSPSNDTGPAPTPDLVNKPLLFITAEARKLIATVNNLSSLGIEDQQIQLPKIVVVGDQSSGKSSLVESLTAVSMPRSSGTCTRVPFHVVIKTSDGPWTCTISLQIDHVYDQLRPKNPWIFQHETTSYHFATLADPQQLGEQLRRAQAALLNPTENHDIYKTCDIQNLQTTAEFSPCQVRIDISSRDVADLSFYDLPGIISQSANETMNLPDFIRNLVARYVSTPNTIILLVQPMNNDCENCVAAAIIRQLNATDRTIGILTKPDLIEPGVSMKNWVDMLDGVRLPVRHGYYVVRSPSQMQLNIDLSRAEALQQEAEFFSTRTPWNDVEFQRFRNRFGSAKVQKEISKQLVSEIRHTLPQIAHHIAHKLHDINNALARLPSPPGPGSLTIVMNLLNQISITLGDVLQGNSRTECIIGWNDLVDTLKRDLFATRPQLSTSSRRPLIKTPETVDLCDSDDDSAPITPSKKRPTTSLKTPSPKKQKVQTGVSIKRDPSDSSSSSSYNQDDGCQPQVFSVKELSALRQRSDISRLKSVIHPRSIDALTRPAIEKWGKPISDFLNAAAELLESQLNLVFHKHLQGYNTTPIATKLPAEAHDFIEKQISDVNAHAIRALHAEQYAPFVNNDDKAVEAAKEEELRALKVLRRPFLVTRYWNAHDKKTGKTTPTAKRVTDGAKLTDEDDLRDEAITELTLLAHANGYLKVAIDALARSISFQVLYAFHEVRDPYRGLVAQLQKLWIEDGGLSICQSLLEVNPAQAQKRVKLEKEKEKLTKAQEALSELMAEHGDKQKSAGLARR